jgi:transposase
MVNQAEIDEGHRLGLSTDERRHMRELEKENRELRRANEILKSAAIFMWNRRLCGLDRSA